MKIIFSPTKQMDRSGKPYSNLPVLLDKTELLLKQLKSMTPLQLQSLWNCSCKLTLENLERLEEIDLHNCLSPAVFSYTGTAFKYLEPETFDSDSLDYLNRNLRILSGFYGILRPDDGISPYRLEMQSKLIIGEHNNLYSYWGSSLMDELRDESGIYINLASKEYSICIEKYIRPEEQLISCIFAQQVGSRIVQKSVYSKMARGAMLRFMAENKISIPAELMEFNELGFSYDISRSNRNCFVFISSDPGSHN